MIRQESRTLATTAVGAERTLTVLTQLAHHPRGIGLEELARELGIPKSSVHRSLGILTRARLAAQDGPRGRYRLGTEFIRLAFAYYEDWDEREVVQPVLEALANRFGEASHYVRLDGSEVVCLGKAVAPGRGVVRMGALVGGREPAHCTAVGKVLLAHALPDQEAVKRYVAAHGPLSRRTEHTLTCPKALHDQLTTIRERGFATEREESELGITCIGFPIFLGSPRNPSGAISVTTLVRRTPTEALIVAAPDIRKLIDELPWASPERPTGNPLFP